MKRSHFFLLSFVIVALTFVGCGQAETEQTSSDSMFRVVGTTTQISDALRVLTAGAQGVEVTGLMGAGVDPHLYQPTEADVRAMNNADLIVYSGLHLEGQFDQVFEALRAQGVGIFQFSKEVERNGFTLTSDDGNPDPHFWFDPRNFALSVQSLAQELARLNPENGDVYSDNGQNYQIQVDLLYNWALESLASVDSEKRFLVTSHDAFQYYGDAFGWQMEAIQGLSTEDEAGVGDIQSTVQFVIDREIPVLFVESSIPPDTIEAVQEAIEAEGYSVQVGVRELFGDAMGEVGSFGGSYLGSIAYNTLTILQSYQRAGETVAVAPWPQDLDLSVPPEFINWSEN